MGKLPGNTGGKGFPKLKFIEQLRSKLVISTIWSFQDGQWGSMDQRIWWPFWRVHELEQILNLKARKKNHVWPENENRPFVVWTYGEVKCSRPIRTVSFGVTTAYYTGLIRIVKMTVKLTTWQTIPQGKPSFHPPVCFILFGCFFSVATVDGWNPYIRWCGIEKTCWWKKYITAWDAWKITCK